MEIRYRTKGVCSREIYIRLKDNVVEELNIYGGCDGNLKGICQLAKGRDAREVSRLLEGIRCGNKLTSCPDQLAKALSHALAQQDTEQPGFAECG